MLVRENCFLPSLVKVVRNTLPTSTLSKSEGVDCAAARTTHYKVPQRALDTTAVHNRNNELAAPTFGLGLVVGSSTAAGSQPRSTPTVHQHALYQKANCGYVAEVSLYFLYICKLYRCIVNSTLRLADLPLQVVK